MEPPPTRRFTWMALVLPAVLVLCLAVGPSTGQAPTTALAPAPGEAHSEEDRARLEAWVAEQELSLDALLTQDESIDAGAADLGVDNEEFLQRMHRQDLLSELAEFVRGRWPLQHGELWIDQSDGRIVVNLTDGVPGAVEEIEAWLATKPALASLSGHVAVTRVDHPWSALLASWEAAVALAPALRAASAGQVEVAISTSANRVEVAIENFADALKAEVEQELGPTVIVIHLEHVGQDSACDP